MAGVAGTGTGTGTQTGPTHNTEYVGLLAVLALALGVRLHGLTAESLWLDEIESMRFASRPLGDLLLKRVDAGNPPLYYLLLKGWMAVFGDGEVAVRLLSAVLGTATVGALYALGRALYGAAVGLAGALLLALSSHHLYYSQEVRMYALTIFLAVTSTHALFAALERGGARRFAVYVALAAAGAYAHYQGFVLMAAQGVAALLAWSVGGFRRKGALRGLIVATVALAAVTVPCVLLYLWGGLLTEGGYGFWQPHVSLRGIARLASAWSPGAPLYTAVLPASHAWLAFPLALPAFFATAAFVRHRRRPADGPILGRGPAILQLGTLHAGVIGYALLALVKRVWHTRYLTVYLPHYLLGLALAVAALRRPWARVSAGLLLAALAVPGLVHSKRTPEKSDWRGAAAFIAERDRGGHAAVILLGPERIGRPFERYYDGRFEVIRDPNAFVREVLRAAAGGRTVLVLYNDQHKAPDPQLATARFLAGQLELRSFVHLPDVHVFEFAARKPKPARAP